VLAAVVDVAVVPPVEVPAGGSNVAVNGEWSGAGRTTGTPLTANAADGDPKSNLTMLVA
jgi:hypothetical protein